MQSHRPPPWDHSLLLILLAWLLFASPLTTWWLALPSWLAPFGLWALFIAVIALLSRRL